MILVFNKIDLISDRELSGLRRAFPAAFFVSGNKNTGMRKLKEGIYIAAQRAGIHEPKIGVVGYPNVGKSSVINALAKRARTSVSGRAGTTKGVQWVRVGEMKLLDSPGVIPLKDSSMKLAIMGAKNPESLRMPEVAAYHLIEIFINEGKQGSLAARYGVDVSGDVGEVLLAIGKRRGFLKKKGVVDERRTAIELLRDWQNGKLKF